MPQVSVIVPVRNGEAHLRETLSSIIGQTLADIEIIVVNDASTDATGDIIAEYAAADSRIRGVDGPGTGSASAARNVGLDLATGDYLSFLDADDIFAPSLLEKLHERARADAADIVVTKFRTVDRTTGEVTLADWAVRLPDLPPKSPFSSEDLGDHVFLAFNPAAWNKLFRTSFIRQAGLRFQEIKRADDLFFSYMALALAERVSVAEGYLIDYYVGNQNSLEGSLDESPLEFVAALDLLHSTLHKTGLYQRRERAFVNVAAEICLANLNKVRTAAAFAEVHAALRTSIYERFAIAGRAPEYFLREYLAVQVKATLATTSEELLFSRLQWAKQATARAQAQARDALREVDMRANAARLSAVLSVPSPAQDAEAAAAASDAEARPDVSVIIPVYNTAEYLDECASSVLAQTRVDIEVICIDDGSTDGSAQLLDGLAGRDSRVVIIRQENAGLSAARNRGIEAARGRYLCFVDSDDWWQGDLLADLVAEADRDRLDLMLFDATTVREPGVSDVTWNAFRTYYERSAYPGVSSGTELLTAMQSRGEYVPSACLYLVRSDHLRRCGLRFYPGIVHEDNLFTFDLMLSAGRAAHNQARLYGRRIRPGSIMTASSRLASARGYFIAYLEMSRSAGRVRYPEPAAGAIAAILFSTLRGVFDNYAALGAAEGDRLKEVDPSPEAQALVMLLAHWRYLLRPKGGPVAPAATPAPAAPEAVKPAPPTPPAPQPRTLRQRMVSRLPRGVVSRLRRLRKRVGARR